MTNVQHNGLVAREAGHAEAIALEGVRVSAQVSGPAVEVTLTQRYKNTERVPIETVYVFPLDEGAAVCGFSARLGEVLIRGRVEEREKAFAQYDDAMLDGDAAFLLEQERPNVFTASIGNLAPGEHVELELRYVARLEREGDALRLAIPTTVSPRYVAKSAPQVGQPEGERINPERRPQVPYGLTLQVDVAGALRSVDSPSHPVRSSFTPEGVRVELSQEDVALDRDFVLLLTPQPAALRSCARVACEPDGRRVALLSFQHAVSAPADVGHEVIFLLDCSGSMAGSSITQAKRALSLCIRALSSDDTFNAVRFGSSVESLFRAGARRYDQASLDEATRYVERIEANLGGTEVLAPLAQILQTPTDRERPRRVLLLTDGQVDNEAEVIALTRAHRDSARVFTFGIGAGASAYLVRGIARASRGATETIFPGERIEPKVLRMFARVRTPALPDLRIDWGGLTVEQAPSELPPVFAGDALTVLARIEGGSASEVRLLGGDQAVGATLDLERAEAGGPIPTLWARERIRELEEQLSEPGAPSREGRGSSQRGDRTAEARRAQLVELGTRYQLLNSACSFVAVQVRSAEARTDQPAQLRRIPVALTSGWGEGARPAPPVALPVMMSMGGPMRSFIPAPAPAPMTPGVPMRPMMRTAAFGESASAGHAPAPDRSLLGRAIDFLSGSASSSDAGADDHAEAPDRLYDLLMTQRADGRFQESDALREWLGATRQTRLDEAIMQHGEEQVVTLVVVLLLEREAEDRRSEWRPAVNKARSWLGAHPSQFDPESVVRPAHA